MLDYCPPQLTVRPFLKWAGGKGKLIQQYLPYFPRYYDRYYEPFLGGGAIFFHLLPEQSHLSDINPELVNVYRCVRNNVEQVIELLQAHERSHSSDYYYVIRSTLFTTEVERAARLIYLNRTCFNGLYRENSKGLFNVPLGRYKNPTICNADLLRAASASLRQADLQVRPFDSLLRQKLTQNDFVYFDPPYYPISSTSSFTAYNRYSFHSEDHVRLRDTFAALADRGVRVMLSNSDCPFVRDLYREFTIHTIYATRAINSKGDRRGKITELLITSY